MSITRIAFVSNITPARPVAEYAYHLIEALKLKKDVELTVICDKDKDPLHGDVEVRDGYTVHRAWNYDSLLTPMKILKAVKKINPDIVWFNITLGAFGNSAANFMGLISPYMTKRAGFKTIITLHNIMEMFDPAKAGGLITRLGGTLATKILTFSDELYVLLSEYEQILKGKYKAKRVRVMPHGLLGDPSYTMLSTSEKRLLSFGMYGTHKKLETLLEAMKIVFEIDPEIQLTIAGGNNAHAIGYLENLIEQYSELRNVNFVGYVDECEVPGLFSDCEAVVLTNESLGGESGAFVQACMYGRPVIASNLPLFSNKVEEGYNIELFDVENPESIASVILSLFSKPNNILQILGRNNFYKVKNSFSMSDVVDKYLGLEIFERKI